MSTQPPKKADSTSQNAGAHPRGSFDENLGFPLADPYWRPYFAKCEVDEITDLDALTTGLMAHSYGFSYLPSANYFFLRADPFYRPIASARSARTGEPAQSSVLVVAKSSPITDWHQLRGKRLGYINTFCTTSYFAPSILLAREGLTLQKFFNAFAVAPWQGQIDAVVAGAIDATSVFEDVWCAEPKNAQTTRILARIDDLPTPVFIAGADIDQAFAASLAQRLLGDAGKPAPGALYAGFSPYQAARMTRFFAELERLPGMAKLGGGARA